MREVWNPSRGLLVSFAEYCECTGSKGVRVLSLRKNKNTNDSIGSGIRLKGLACALKVDTIDVSGNVRRSAANSMSMKKIDRYLRLPSYRVDPTWIHYLHESSETSTRALNWKDRECMRNKYISERGLIPYLSYLTSNFTVNSEYIVEYIKRNERFACERITNGI